MTGLYWTTTKKKIKDVNCKHDWITTREFGIVFDCRNQKCIKCGSKREQVE